ENVERNMALGMSPREAAHRTMDEGSAALNAIALTRCAVFVPSAFIAGISGAFFKQFALTIAASTVISCFNSLTLSPALCALLLKPHGGSHGHAEALPKLGIGIIGALVAHHFLLAPVGHMFGIDIGGHAEAAPAAHEPGHSKLILDLALYAVGLAAGYLVSKPINRL